ncbi:MAG: response regulator transcription factor [Campylobacterales bacterium]|nr:response regulator transcription factor [Campylobacterales bacterium]
MGTTILIIEDETDLLELMEYHFQKAGFETAGFLSTKNVEKFLEEERVDAMIVDRNLPGAEGSEFVEKLRQKGIDAPVIFVTAKDSDTNIEEGFLRGGDDYLTKPFNMNELVLRVRAILKRAGSTPSSTLIHRDITLNLDTREVFVGRTNIELTKLEFDLLHTLITHKHSVLNREFLLEKVWEEEAFYQDKTVNVAINRLKKKIDPGKEKNYIKSIWGVGYTLC